MFYTPQIQPMATDPVVVERQIQAYDLGDGTFSTSTLIQALWGKINAEKMGKILACESGLRQWDDKGNVLESVTEDVGISQIHIGTSTPWYKESLDMGLNIQETADNLVMAYYIWNIQGFGAWSCAKKVAVL